MIEPDLIDNLICVLNEQIEEGFLTKDEAMEILQEEVEK